MIDYYFLYAKIHAIHSKSYYGEKLARLKNIKSIESLQKELFPNSNVQMEKDSLYSFFQKEFKFKMIDCINKIIKLFQSNNDLINVLNLRHEINNIKLLIRAYYQNIKKVDNIFIPVINEILDYKLIHSLDISDIKNIKKIFNKTIFNFIISLIEQTKDIFEIENQIDKFYYQVLLKSLDNCTKYEKNKLTEVIKEEINWHNILWAFRIKTIYDKKFEEINDSFIINNNIIPLKDLEQLFKFSYDSGDLKNIITDFPLKYQQIILDSYNDRNEFSFDLLKKNIQKNIDRLYLQFFYIENSNILPVVSFIYLKWQEYFNVARVIEEVRYRL